MASQGARGGLHELTLVMHRVTGDPARWDRVENLFAEALARPREERARWVATQAPDAETRAELEAMLAAHDRVTGILDRGVVPIDDDVGERLEDGLTDRYTIVRRLGRGGSATVFLAREHKHDRSVVLKVLHPEIAAHVGMHRFLSEVRIAAQLAHPNILPLIDSGEVDGLLYYVMPYLDGETLRDRLTRMGRIPVRESIELLRDIASALAAVHAAGIVHRDLKPENVLCARDHAYLLDFGIAVRDDSWSSRHTQEGVVVGTIGYMSPEQSEGRSVGPESDVFAWGVLAREMLTGVGPLGAVPGDHPPVPPALTALVRQTLDPDPVRRPRSADEVLVRLGAIDQKPVERPKRRALPVALVAVVVLAAVAFALAVRTRPDVDASVLSPVAVAPLRNETGDTALTIWGRMAADWLTQGLHETSLVNVVPWPTVRHAWDRLDSAGTGITPSAIASEVGSGTVVTGSYYLNADRVTFRLDVTDARRGRLLASLPAVVVARDSLDVALRELRDRLMGFVALQLDERVASLPGLATRPPTFSAYRAFDRGLELYNEQEYAAAATEFRQAWSADTTFPVPLIYAAMAHWNQGQFDWVDTLVSVAERARDRLSEYDRLQLEYLAAILASDGVRAIAAATRAVEIAPESRAAYNLGRDLLAVGRVAEGRQVLERIDPNRGMLQGWSSYWTQLTHARHLTGAHEEERRAARMMRERFPDSRVALVLEARALAAAGNTSGLDSLLTHTATLPAGTYWSHAAALVVAGEELVVHHDSTRGLPYLERAVAWLRGELRADPGRREHRYWLASALYDLARWSEAEVEFSALNRDFPDRLLYQGLAALGRARIGDRAGAEHVLGPVPRVARSEHTMYRARLAAVSGDTAIARTLRQQALDEIATGYAWLHASAFRDFGSKP